LNIPKKPKKKSKKKKSTSKRRPSVRLDVLESLADYLQDPVPMKIKEEFSNNPKRPN